MLKAYHTYWQFTFATFYLQVVLVCLQSFVLFVVVTYMRSHNPLHKSTEAVWLFGYKEQMEVVWH
ncbi:MAG: hypothetical protein L3J43_07040 [Sulfurovum sp.]|nr:hypothetical protein [Sulfurovum sp.]